MQWKIVPQYNDLATAIIMQIRKTKNKVFESSRTFNDRMAKSQKTTTGRTFNEANTSMVMSSRSKDNDRAYI